MEAQARRMTKTMKQRCSLTLAKHKKREEVELGENNEEKQQVK